MAKGFTERAGIDFFNTYAPTMKLASLRILFAVAVHLKWDLRLLDVDSAFLMSVLPPTEVIYMDYLPGMRRRKGCALRLLRSIYGLKQAAYHWNQNIHGTVTSLGYV